MPSCPSFALERCGCYSKLKKLKITATCHLDRVTHGPRSPLKQTNKETKVRDWECDSVVEHELSMHEALVQSPVTKKEKRLPIQTLLIIAPNQKNFKCLLTIKLVKLK